MEYKYSRNLVRQVHFGNYLLLFRLIRNSIIWASCKHCIMCHSLSVLYIILKLYHAGDGIYGLFCKIKDDTCPDWLNRKAKKLKNSLTASCAILKTAAHYTCNLNKNKTVAKVSMLLLSGKGHCSFG